MRDGYAAEIDGYEVIGSDDAKLGRVVAVDGAFLIAEEGTPRKKRHAIPKAFAHPDDSEQVVRLTVSKEPDGELVSYRRTRRYARGRTE